MRTSSINICCEECGSDFVSLDIRRRFCSQKCSAIHSNRTRTYDYSTDVRKKHGHCMSCGIPILVSIRTNLKRCKCDKCRTRISKKKPKSKKKQFCKYCGEDVCKREDVCKKYRIFPTLIKYFGFDSSVVGSTLIYEEFDRIKNVLIEDYDDSLLSLNEMCNKYNHDNVMNFSKILNSLDIRRRTVSSSVINLYKMGKLTSPVNSKYKHGWHTTWDGKQVFYRSSYELDFCDELDNKKIPYTMEKLRILYWDSQLNKQRVAIPDFYLSDTNEIVEVKSDYTLDKQNMLDKKKAYLEHGYKFKLILEHKEENI